MIVEGASAGLHAEHMAAILTTAAQHKALERGAQTVNASNDGTLLPNESAESPLSSNLSPSGHENSDGGSAEQLEAMPFGGDSGSLAPVVVPRRPAIIPEQLDALQRLDELPLASKQRKSKRWTKAFFARPDSDESIAQMTNGDDSTWAPTADGSGYAEV